MKYAASSPSAARYTTCHEYFRISGAADLLVQHCGKGLMKCRHLIQRQEREHTSRDAPVAAEAIKSNSGRFDDQPKKDAAGEQSQDHI
jgi:hypothetical protein